MPKHTPARSAGLRLDCLAVAFAPGFPPDAAIAGSDGHYIFSARLPPDAGRRPRYTRQPFGSGYPAWRAGSTIQKVDYPPMSDRILRHDATSSPTQVSRGVYATISPATQNAPRSGWRSRALLSRAWTSPSALSRRRRRSPPPLDPVGSRGVGDGTVRVDALRSEAIPQPVSGGLAFRSSTPERLVSRLLRIVPGDGDRHGKWGWYLNPSFLSQLLSSEECQYRPREIEPPETVLVAPWGLLFLSSLRTPTFSPP